jgi:hypothetical protein
MKKRLLGLAAIPLVLVLSSCFSLQSFSLGKGALAPGGLTNATFVVRPASNQATGFNKGHQFVLVGVSNTADIGVGKATWNVKKNNVFAPIQNMPASTAVATSIGTQCDTTGFSFSGISGSVTWKGFITLNPVSDKKAVGQTVVIQVGIKAKSTATHDDTVNVVGLTGMWVDSNSDGIVNPPDSFLCSGNATTSIFIT